MSLSILLMGLFTVSQPPADADGSLVLKTFGDHNPAIVCPAIRNMFERVKIDNLVWPAPSFFTRDDGFSDKPYQLFFESHGVKDQKPLRIEKISVLVQDDVRPVYLVFVHRSAWTLPPPPELVTVPGQPARRTTAAFIETVTPWLFAFDADIIAEVQEVPAMRELASRLPSFVECK